MRNFVSENNRLMKKIGFIIMMLVLIAALAACGQSKTGTNAGANPPAQNNSAALETQYPLTITDASGTEVLIEQAPQRIVSLVPSETETLFAVGAGSEIVGVDQWSNYPKEVLAIEKVGDMSTNIEAVAALNPDLVVGSASMNGEALEQLRALGVVVFGSDPKTLEETIAHIEQIGTILNRQAEATAVTGEMREVIQRVTDAVKDAPAKKVYLEFSPGYSLGKETFLDELLTLAGGENVAGDQAGWFEVDEEIVLQSNPEVIIYPDIEGDTTIPDLINSRPGWEEIDAVKNGKVFAVSNDPLVRVGPRLTVGLLELAQAIHPDLVTE